MLPTRKGIPDSPHGESHQSEKVELPLVHTPDIVDPYRRTLAGQYEFQFGDGENSSRGCYHQCRSSSWTRNSLCPVLNKLMWERRNHSWQQKRFPTVE